MAPKRGRDGKDKAARKKRKTNDEKITTQGYDQLNNIEGMDKTRLSAFFRGLMPKEYNVCSSAEAFLTAIFLVCHYRNFDKRQNADEADKRWAAAIENEDPSGITNTKPLSTILNPETGYRDAELSKNAQVANWTLNKIQIKVKKEKNSKLGHAPAGPTKEWTIMQHTTGDLFKTFAQAIKAAIPNFSSENMQHVRDATRLVNATSTALGAADRAKAALFLPASMSFKRPGVDDKSEASYGRAGGYNNAPYLAYGHNTAKALKRALSQQYFGLATIWQTVWNISAIEHTIAKKKPSDPMYLADKARNAFGGLTRGCGDIVMSKLFNGTQFNLSFSAGLQLIVSNAIAFESKLKRVDVPHPVFWSLMTPAITQKYLDGDLVGFWNAVSPKVYFDVHGFGNVDFEQWVLLQTCGNVFTPTQIGPKVVGTLVKRSEVDMTQGDGAAKKGSIKLQAWAPAFSSVRTKIKRSTVAGPSNGYMGRERQVGETFMTRLVTLMDKKTDAATAKEAILNRWENVNKAYDTKEKHTVQYWADKGVTSEESLSVNTNFTFYVDSYSSADTGVPAPTIKREKLADATGYEGIEVAKVVPMDTGDGA